jgi:hypothetical protein
MALKIAKRNKKILEKPKGVLFIRLESTGKIVFGEKTKDGKDIKELSAKQFRKKRKERRKYYKARKETIKFLKKRF